MKTKRTKPSALVIASLLCVCAAGVNAQSLKRISFARGKNSAVVKGTTGPYGTTYVLGVRSGQKMVITVTPAAAVGIKIETNGRFGRQVLLRSEAGGTHEVGIEESGDHTIFIGPIEGKPVSFTLIVKIAKLADI